MKNAFDLSALGAATCLALGLLLASGCQSESGPTGDAAANSATDSGDAVTLTAAPPFNTAGAPTVVLEVPDMMCEQSCAAKVREVLAEQTGVQEVQVDFPTKRATLAVDQAAFNAEAAVAALVDYQFSNTKLAEDK
jgi:copper chaperone CopZ